MSPRRRTELESIARQWISLWSAPVVWQFFERLHADRFEDCASAGRPNTKQAFGKGIAKLIGAFPDLATWVEDLVVEESMGRVAVRWSSVGTKRAAYFGVGPIGTSPRTHAVRPPRRRRLASRTAEIDRRLERPT